MAQGLVQLGSLFLGLQLGMTADMASVLMQTHAFFALLLAALLLFLATVVTGAYWLAERFYFLPQRRRAAQALLDADTQRRAELDASRIHPLGKPSHRSGQIQPQPPPARASGIGTTEPTALAPLCRSRHPGL